MVFDCRLIVVIEAQCSLAGFIFQSRCFFFFVCLLLLVDHHFVLSNCPGLMVASGLTTILCVGWVFTCLIRNVICASIAFTLSKLLLKGGYETPFRRVLGLMFNLAFLSFQNSPTLVFLHAFCPHSTAHLITSPPPSSFSFPPRLPPNLLWTLMPRPLRQCGLCLQGCQGRDTAHRDPEWDKLTVTMFPLSMWSWEKEKVKRRDWWLKGKPAAVRKGGGGAEGRKEEEGRTALWNVWIEDLRYIAPLVF